MWPPKRKVSMCFFAKVGHHVLKSNNGVRHFWPKFQGVCQDLQRFCMDLQGFCSHFQGFSQIFRYFVRIFDESKLLRVHLHPMQPCLLHLWVQWNMKTTALFVQVYYYTSMYLVWDIPKIYVWRTVGHVQNSYEEIYVQNGNPCSPRKKLTRLLKKSEMWNRNPNFRLRYRFQLHHLKDLAPTRVQIIQNWLGSRSGCAVLFEF